MELSMMKCEQGARDGVEVIRSMGQGGDCRALYQAQALGLVGRLQ